MVMQNTKGVVDCNVYSIHGHKVRDPFASDDSPVVSCSFLVDNLLMTSELFFFVERY